jgi:hypothetical protein
MNFDRFVTFEMKEGESNSSGNPVICSSSSFIVSIFLSFCWYQTLVRKKNKTLILFPFQRQQSQISCGWKKNESPCIF